MVPEPPPPARARTSRGRLFAVQVIVSGLVLGSLLADIHVRELGRAVGGVCWPWLLVAGGCKAVALLTRELRLWVTLRTWGRPALPRVLVVGLASGLLNVVLPARGGDVAAAALLHRTCAVPGPAALAGVGLTSLVEAVVFALVLLGSFLGAGSRWEDLIGLAETHRAQGALTTATLAVLGVGVLVAVVARRLAGQREAQHPGPRAFLLQLIADTGRGLGAVWIVAASAALAMVQVAALLGANLLLLHALGVTVADPLLAAVALMAVGSLVAILLPPTLVAGNAATSVGILGLFGVDQASGMAAGVLMWAVQCLPTLLLGAWPLWLTVARAGGVRGSGSPGDAGR